MHRFDTPAFATTRHADGRTISIGRNERPEQGGVDARGAALPGRVLGADEERRIHDGGVLLCQRLDVGAEEQLLDWVFVLCVRCVVRHEIRMEG